MPYTTEPTGLRLARQSTLAAVAEAALDEAFATVSVPERRRDAGHATRETLTETAQLAETLREQLSSLDAQRRHLAQLLEGMGA
ncbi:hypothetical protein [Botrimarina mediterranea]|uniref:Uncharacterized protein n=1 Tax=Botrimarina mediterranea TaxID=2528022 RepID=A0A518KCG4_9BACT|nr:hypothetical protein [Botrimarina mediterranea]QDV75490.1 hypothetical protein Spa11_37080 [Botrimarina mediterranea]QDV80123.1 hypothetical protein K2D_37470 [Planctomycetes bacterium K2D]